MYRQVLGQLYNAVGNVPLKRALVSFTFNPGSFTDLTQYITPTVAKVKTDETGSFTVDLWANEEGEQESEYTCTLPNGESFDFTVPGTSSDPIQLSVLREGGSNVIDPQYTTLINYVDTQIASIVVGSLAEQTFTGQSNITVNHNRGYRPVVALTDQSGNEIDASIEHTSLNSFTVAFNVPRSGQITYF
jgi:hypothetical protein